VCRVLGTARVRRERWLQVLDGMRRQRGIRTCSTRRPRRPQFRRGAFVMSGGNSQEESSHRERAAYLPRRRAVGARGSSVGGSVARLWRRRHLLREAAASDRPPTVRPASGGGMFGAHGKIAYLSLPFCALMRALKCARGSSTVGCCVWAFGTVGRTRSSSGDSGPHRSACTAHLGASDGLNSFAALLRRADE